MFIELTKFGAIAITSPPPSKEEALCLQEAMETLKIPPVLFTSKNVTEITFGKPTKKDRKGIKRFRDLSVAKSLLAKKEVFQKILEERGSYSQVSGQYLGEGFNPWWFSHIVPKSIATRLRLDPKNIILKTPEEHTLWENHKHKIRDDIKWKWIFELEEQLKQEYNNQ